jgi:hypothetical protein
MAHALAHLPVASSAQQDDSGQSWPRASGMLLLLQSVTQLSMMRHHTHSLWQSPLHKVCRTKRQSNGPVPANYTQA